jgi:hypothetical protein
MVKSGFKNDVPVRSVRERRTCVTICHLLNIGRLLGRNLKWNPDAEQFIGDAEANAMLIRPVPKGYEWPEV